MVLFVRLHQSHSVTVLQRELHTFSRGDENPKMLDQDGSFSFPVGEMMREEAAQPVCVLIPWAHCIPSHGAAGHHCTSGAALGRSTEANNFENL